MTREENTVRRIIAIGGGEIKNKSTLKIDEYVAALAKEHAGDRRANALFIGTASHDSMPYFNSFRKTYTSVFDIKAEVALIVYGEMDIGRIADKIENADMLYIGGGNTVFMLNKWRETGLDRLILSAYEKGKIICGLSAGAICWFEDIYTDSFIMDGTASDYKMEKGLGVLKGAMCPHFDEREVDFTRTVIQNSIKSAYCAENNAALEFVNEKFRRVLSAGGNAYMLTSDGVAVRKEKL